MKLLDPASSIRSALTHPMILATLAGLTLAAFDASLPPVLALPIELIGPKLETPRMSPERANTGFALIESPSRIRLKVWERGAGLTLACGSGACAALVNAHRRGLTGRQATVAMDGGELLITWAENGHVLMRGPAETAFAGELPDLV